MKDTQGLIPIVSPMVGTVYLAPNPESPAYVASGAGIDPDSTVCLIEAMKGLQRDQGRDQRHHRACS